MIKIANSTPLKQGGSDVLSNYTHKVSKIESLTSNRYNRGQLYNNHQKPSKTHVFSIDWFEANCLHGLGLGLLKDFDFEAPEDEYTCFHTTLRKDKKTGNGTRQYKYGYDVLFNNQSIGLLLLCPRQAFRNEYSCSLKLHNHILYQNAWTLIIGALLDDIGLTINNFTRIDIACDGSGFMNKYKLLNEGIYQNVGRSGHSNYQTGKNIITGFDIGSKRSDKYVTGYCKGQRLKTEQKPYISEYWQKNNLVTPIENVERLELKLKNKAIKSIVAFDYKRLEDQVYLASIMKSQLDGFFQLVKNSSLKTDKNITRAKKIDLIPWHNLELSKVVKMKKIKKPSTVWGMKRYLTVGLQMIEAGYFPKENLFDKKELERLRVLAVEYEIENWFDDLVKRIKKRDKTQIDEMTCNRKLVAAGDPSIYSNMYNH